MVHEADAGANSSIILKAFTLVPFIKDDDSKSNTCSTMGGQFTTNKIGILL
jgi:hypothetical protein